MPSERITVDIKEHLTISTTLDNFIGWLKGYMKHNHDTTALIHSYDNDADILQYQRNEIGGLIEIQVVHVGAEALRLSFLGYTRNPQNVDKIRNFLDGIKSDIDERWLKEHGISMHNTTSTAIFKELLQEVRQLTFDEAQTPKGGQLAKRIREAIVKQFGIDHTYARELGPIRFYHSGARKRNRPKYFEQDKQRATGVLSRILDDVQLGQDSSSLTPEYILEINPLFGEPLHKDQEDWADVFVLMPFKPEFDKIYQENIRSVVERMGLSCQRGDDFRSNNIIMLEIWSAIFYSQICIADCTGRNPNVFYEIGIAHTLGRECILIAQSTDDIPFDVGHYRTIPYTPGNVAQFEADLAKTIESIQRKRKF